MNSSADPGRFKKVKARVTPCLKVSLSKAGLKLGDPVFMRVFKESKELELWVKKGKRYQLFKTYPVATWGWGGLGPKLKEGDGQAPEGFYFVPRSQMNPQSKYHLAFNLGYPNDYDRSLKRTGSFLMVHGGRASIGCYAMTDPAIEEIYTIADAAHVGGQKFFRVHAFPFRMTSDRLAKSADSKWYGFWKNLKTGYDLFEKTKIPPSASVARGRYRFSKGE